MGRSLRSGMGAGLTGIGSIAGLGIISPWTILLFLAGILVLGFFFWWWIVANALTTAFAGFVAGGIFAWFASKISDEFHAWIIGMPIILGVGGYFAEYTKIWTVPTTFSFRTNSVFGLSDEITWTIQFTLILIVAVLTIIDFAYAWGKRK